MPLKKYIVTICLGFSVLSATEFSQAVTRGRFDQRTAVAPTGKYVKKGILFEIAAYLGSNDLSSTEAQSSLIKSSFLDIKLGYINEAAYYYGAQYTLREDATRTTKSYGRGSGFGIGYFWYLGFDLRAYYRFHETYADYSSGSGFQVDFGYSGRIISNVYIGFLVDYREIRYLTNASSPTADSTTLRSLQPAVSLGYLF